VTDVQVTVRFWWKTGMDPATEFTGPHILIDDGPDKIGASV
jgi:hypothetical protein